MDLSIIIVNWKVKELVRQLLVSIFRYTQGLSFEVFVVDNHSEDGSAEMIKSEFPRVRLMANQENLGFARANNQALRASQGDFLLLLNPDTEVFDDSLVRMAAWLRKHPEIDLASGRVLNPDHSLQRTIRHFPTVFSQLMIILKLHHLWPASRPIRWYLATDFDYEKEQEVDQVIGAFFCFRRSVLEKIGFLDERFFLWYEEVDYCLRAKQAGLKIVYHPDFSIIHHGGESFARVFALRKQRYLNQSLLKYARRHWGWGAYLLFLLVSPLSLVLAWFVQILRIKPAAYKRMV